MVVGMDFSIIAAASEEPSFFPEKVFGSLDATRPFLLSLTESSEYASVRDLDGWFRFPDHVTGLGSLCVNITQHGQSAYRLLLLDTKKDLSDSEGFLLEFLAEMIHHAFLHNVMQKTSPAQSLHTVLLRALDDRMADYIAVSQALDALGWHSRHTYCCLYLQLSDMDQKNLTANSVCAYLENILTGCSAFPHGGGIVAFFNLTLSDFSMTDLMERMVHFVEDSSLNAGFSRCMNGHMNLRRQYIQAKIALQFGTRKYPDKRMHPFNDISFDYILDQATKKLPGYMLCHERLLFLQEHDDSSGSDYMRTLRCYLDNHCNVVQTARELFIHRSTLLYRLEKIKEILESDLSSPDEILYRSVLSTSRMKKKTVLDLRSQKSTDKTNRNSRQDIGREMHKQIQSGKCNQAGQNQCGSSFFFVHHKNRDCRRKRSCRMARWEGIVLRSGNQQLYLLVNPARTRARCQRL